jgi:Arc/MetJ-type ribon-helix-helix transcriptional regulator
MAKIITVSLNKSEEQRLDELVQFFQKKSISTVTRSDVIKFLLNRTHEITHHPKIDDAESFYKTLGIEYNFEIIHFKKELEN